MSIHEALDFDREKVSIVTPCYNASDFLRETYESIKRQTHENWEWIVTDDHSTDTSLAILEEISREDDRVLIRQTQINSGAAVARNVSLESASGGYIAFLDVDDLWEPEKLSLQTEFMRENQCQFSFHSYKLIDQDNSLVKVMSVPKLVTAKEILKFNPFATSSVMICHNIIKRNNLWFPKHLRRRQDYIFWYNVLKIIEVAKSIPNELSSYRIMSENSLSGNKKKMALIQWKIYREEFKLNIFESMFYFFQYAFHGVKKYFF